LNVDATLQRVVDLEHRLLDPETRRDPARVASLLHPEFREIGASGRVWNRDDILAALAVDPGTSPRVCDIAARRVVDDVVLVTYRTHDSLRSSLWVRHRDEWRVLFHQGTRRHGSGPPAATPGMPAT
jgi:ribonuclease HI